MEKIKFDIRLKKDNPWIDIEPLKELTSIMSKERKFLNIKQGFKGNIDALIFKSSNAPPAFYFCSIYRIPLIKYINALKSPSISFIETIPQSMPVRFERKMMRTIHNPDEFYTHPIPVIDFYPEYYYKVRNQFKLSEWESGKRCAVCRYSGIILCKNPDDEAVDSASSIPCTVFPIYSCPHDKYENPDQYVGGKNTKSRKLKVKASQAQ